MAEGGALLRRYTDKIRIEGSNPSLSARDPIPMELRLNRFVCCACVLAALAFPAFAQFPARAVTLVVATPPGGPADVAAKMIATKLIERWGRAVLVDNKPGAAGLAFVAGAEADGHVLLMGNVATQAIEPSLYKKLPYDAARAFAPVSLVAEVPLVLLVQPSIKAQGPGDVVALARQKPQTLKYSSAGNGSLMHLAAVLFENTTRVQLSHSPQKGEAEALSAVLSGNATLAFAPLTEALGPIAAGKLRALAVTSAQRAPAVPKLQTVAESGFPGYEAASWFGILAPAGTTAAVLDKISKDVQRVATGADVRHKLEQQGAITVGSSPAQFKSRIDSDRQRYGRVIHDRGITPD